MDGVMVRLRLRSTLVLLAAVLAVSVVPTSADATVIDDALEAVTCSELVASLGDATPAEVAELLATSYCHDQSDSVVCVPAGEPCTVSGDSAVDDGTVSVRVDGVADPGGVMVLAVGRSDQQSACGLPMYVGITVRFESAGVRDLVASHDVTKSLDQATPQNGAGNLHVCYQSPKPFVDRDGQTTMVGILPDCEANGDVAPCVSQRNKHRADAQLAMDLPPGDPSWQMVVDTVDRYTG
jgi:hypothetical protein